MKTIWFVLGHPGSGKSTLCYNSIYKHLPLGQLLRDDKDYKEIIQKCMQTGTLIPPIITVTVLKNALEDYNGSILIDGFPRNLENILFWEQEVGIKIKGVIFMDCPSNICLQRLSQRKRIDDNNICIQKRLLSFTLDTLPVIKYYKKQNLVYTLDATLSIKLLIEKVNQIFIHGKN